MQCFSFSKKIKKKKTLNSYKAILSTVSKNKNWPVGHNVYVQPCKQFSTNYTKPENILLTWIEKIYS